MVTPRVPVSDSFLSRARSLSGSPRRLHATTCDVAGAFGALQRAQAQHASYTRVSLVSSLFIVHATQCGSPTQPALVFTYGYITGIIYSLGDSGDCLRGDSLYNDVHLMSVKK